MSAVKHHPELIELGKIVGETKGDSGGDFRENGSPPWCFRKDFEEGKMKTPCIP